MRPESVHGFGLDSSHRRLDVDHRVIITLAVAPVGSAEDLRLLIMGGSHRRFMATVPVGHRLRADLPLHLVLVGLHRHSQAGHHHYPQTCKGIRLRPI